MRAQHAHATMYVTFLVRPTPVLRDTRPCALSSCYRVPHMRACAQRHVEVTYTPATSAHATVCVTLAFALQLVCVICLRVSCPCHIVFVILARIY